MTNLRRGARDTGLWQTPGVTSGVRVGCSGDSLSPSLLIYLHVFRLQRGENTCQIEEFVLGSWPQERKTGGRRRRRRRHRGSQGLRRTRHGRRPHREQGRERSSARKHYFQVR